MNEVRAEPSAENDDEGETDVELPSSKPATAPVFRPLRIWPVVLLLICMWALRIIPSMSAETSMPMMMMAFMGPMIFAGMIALWWLFLSRARWTEKALGFVGLVVIVAVTTQLADNSNQSMSTMINAIPWGMTGFAVAAICVARVASFRRTGIALLGALICFGFWDTVRTDATWGNFRTVRSWRWEPTSEDLFLESLASLRSQPGLAASTAEPLGEPEWSAFRGPNRDGAQPSIKLHEDWDAQPPKELWRVRIGPGWSSFSVAGHRLFTQEQRGENEVIVCYEAGSGQEIWAYSYTSRFWESAGDAGPRATPTLSDGNLFALGAAGILLRIDPITGGLVWQRDIAKDAGRKPPRWGFVSSPLVTGGVVIVHGGGSGEKGVLAYDVETGDLRWSSPAGDHGYSSAQLSNICGKS